MIELFGEGIESLRLPCSWVLLFPAAGLTVFARRRGPLVLAAFLLAVITVAWLRFGGWWFGAPGPLLQVLIGVAVTIAVVVAWRRDAAESDATLAALCGGAAAWAWIPCVGPDLGELLNDARTDAAGELPGTIAYIVGLCLPFVMIVALTVAVPRIGDALRRNGIVIAGAVLVAAFGILFMTTLFDDVASELARRSTF